MRSISVGVLSITITSMVIAYAYYQKKQFYPTVVYITKSNPSMAVMYIQAFLLVILAGKIMKKLFFGELRPAEFEHLVERAWYAITETCLAFTVFKDDFSPKFVALFTLLLFLKCFHWLAEDRVDFMERSPVISWLFHTRIVMLLSLLAALDVYFITVAYYWTVAKGASVHLVFGFEYAILSTIVFNISLKYVLHAVDIGREVFWENKAVFLLHMELFIGFLKVILYLLFVGLMIRLYTLPLFAFRPMYYTLRAFKKALHDVIMSRRAIRNMNTLYPDATPAELAAGDNVCIICREEMHTSSKKLPCNHIFHTSCLRSWFQRHQTCPTCRLNILRPTPDGQQHTTPARPAAPPAPQNQPGQPPFAFPWQPFFLPFQVPGANNLENMAAGNARGDGGGQQPPIQQQPLPGQSSQPPRQPMPGEFNQQQSTQFTNSFPAGQNRPNFSSPSFPFPFMFPPVPLIPGISNPPLPPQNFNGLSEEELRQMEDSSRRGIEARLQCLRNIQLLMDASVILMQQYVTSASVATSTSSTNNVANNENPTPGPSREADTQSSSFSQDSNTPGQSSSSDRNVPKPSTSRVPDTSEPSSSKEPHAPEPSSSRELDTSDSSSSEEPDTPSVKSDLYTKPTSLRIPPMTDDRSRSDLSQAPLSEQEKMRRKRIEKLDKTKNGSSST